MDANELARIESFGEAANSFPQQVTATACVDLNVVAGRFDPGNFIGVDEHHASRSLDHQSSLTLRRALGLGQQVENMMGQFTIMGLEKFCSRSLNRSLEPALINRLYQEIKCARFECTHGVLMVCAGENHHRRIFLSYAIQRRDSSAILHFDIE